MFIRKIPNHNGRNHSYNYFYQAHYGKGVTSEEGMVRGAVYWCALPEWVEPDEEDYLVVLWMDQGLVGLKSKAAGYKFQLSILDFQRLLLDTYEEDLREVLKVAVKNLGGPLNKRALALWTAQRDKVLKMLNL